MGLAPFWFVSEVWSDARRRSVYNGIGKGATAMTAIPAQFVVDDKGRKTAVLLSVKRYEKMLEDLHDLAVVAERRDEPTITLEEMKRRLKKDGVL
jgi:hypothetical protein